MSTFSDVPPSWLTIVEWVHDVQFDVTVNHGTAGVKFTLPATISKKDLMDVVMKHKIRMINDHERAMRVAQTLTP